MILTYQSQEIQQRDQDNFVSLTQMAKANKVKVSHWLELEGTKSYLKCQKRTLVIFLNKKSPTEING